MNIAARRIIGCLTTGIIWCAFMKLFFIVSGAQQILADPARQSTKFLKVFMEYQPLPRMATDGGIVWEGFFICGFLTTCVFLIVNNALKGSWPKKGIVFGLMHWALMTPWFEFYLPYNVMNEPLSLVLLECLLWLLTLVCTGLYMSLVLNFRRAS